jgi:hypothetical protein
MSKSRKKKRAGRAGRVPGQTPKIVRVTNYLIENPDAERIEVERAIGLEVSYGQFSEAKRRAESAATAESPTIPMEPKPLPAEVPAMIGALETSGLELVTEIVNLAAAAGGFDRIEQALAVARQVATLDDAPAVLSTQSEPAAM